MTQHPDGMVPHPAADLAFRKANTPEAAGLFDPARETDACGVGFIVNLKNQPSHKIVQNGLAILENLDHALHLVA